jgi:hypothetical protein
MARRNTKQYRLDETATIGWFLTLDRPENVRTASGRISGSTVPGRVVVSSPKVIAERFANWKTDDASIVRFTKQYGPLKREWIEGNRFCFDGEEWRRFQRLYRQSWRLVRPEHQPELAALGIGKFDELVRVARLGDPAFLQLYKGNAALALPDMKTILDVCLAFIPFGKMRICPADACKTPFFIAHSERQIVCGADQCTDWLDRKRKLEWWDKNKGPLLEQRRKSRRK